MYKKTLFIDRDGTLIAEPIKTLQVDSLKKLSLEPYVIPSLLKIQELGYRLVMITNQDGLGTNLFPQVKFDVPHNFMLKIFNSQGVFFEDILICPHTALENCECRKPKTKLIEKWLKKNSFDKENTYVIGDRITDIELAKNINVIGFQYDQKKLNWKKILKILIKRNRFAHIKNISKETKIEISVWLDQNNVNDINTGIKFFDHMLEQICIHGNFSAKIIAKGDLHVDDHHTIEDTALSLGKALSLAIGKKIGINRFGYITPMDESLATCAIDICNRPYLKYKAKFKNAKIGDLNTDMIEHFFRSFAYSMSITLHISAKGKNDHHLAESMFKALGSSLKQAIKINSDYLPSSKGVL